MPYAPSPIPQLMRRALVALLAIPLSLNAQQPGMPDGSKILRGEARGPVVQAEALGIQLADDLLARGAAEILAATK